MSTAFIRIVVHAVLSGRSLFDRLADAVTRLEYRTLARRTDLTS